MRGRSHAQALGYPLQRHGSLAPQTPGDPNLPWITLALALEILRGPSKQKTGHVIRCFDIEDPDGNEMRTYQVLASDTQVTGERQQQ